MRRNSFSSLIQYNLFSQREYYEERVLCFPFWCDMNMGVLGQLDPPECLGQEIRMALASVLQIKWPWFYPEGEPACFPCGREWDLL